MTKLTIENLATTDFDVIRRGQDSNLQPSDHESDELTNSSTPLASPSLSFTIPT
jgi:hypothetical protein